VRWPWFKDAATLRVVGRSEDAELTRFQKEAAAMLGVSIIVE
jgi:hypothetical protein